MTGSNTTVTPSELMKRQMDIEAGLPDVQNASDVVSRIQDTILAAPTDADVFAAAEAGLASGEDLVDVPISIQSFTYNRSSYTDSTLPVYAVVTAVRLATGETVQFSLGAQSALAQLHRWQAIQPFAERDGFLCALRSKKTASGNSAMFFRPLTPSEYESSVL